MHIPVPSNRVDICSPGLNDVWQFREREWRGGDTWDMSAPGAPGWKSRVVPPLNFHQYTNCGVAQMDKSVGNTPKQRTDFHNKQHKDQSLELMYTLHCSLVNINLPAFSA